MATSALFTSIKLVKLTRRLGIPRPHVIGHLECLTHYVSHHHATGDISSLTDEDIELAAEWNGEPGAFVDAAVTERFIDRDEAGTRIHDWQEWCPEFVKKRIKRMGGQQKPETAGGDSRPPTADNGGQRQPPADNGNIDTIRRDKTRQDNESIPSDRAGQGIGIDSRSDRDRPIRGSEQRAVMDLMDLLAVRVPSRNDDTPHARQCRGDKTSIERIVQHTTDGDPDRVRAVLAIARDASRAPPDQRMRRFVKRCKDAGLAPPEWK